MVLVVSDRAVDAAPQPRRRARALLAMLQFSDSAAAAIVSAAAGGFEAGRRPQPRARRQRRPDPLGHRRQGVRDDPVGRSAGTPPRSARRRGCTARIVRRGRCTAAACGSRRRAIGTRCGRTCAGGRTRSARRQPRGARALRHMSPATILFVLADMMARGATGEGIAIAFGPSSPPRSASPPHEPFTSLRAPIEAEEEMDAVELPARALCPRARRPVADQRATMAPRPTLGFPRPGARPRGAGTRPWRILDVGYGAGDMLARIADWGARRGVALDLAGVDLNPKSEAVAAVRLGERARLITGDYRGPAGVRLGHRHLQPRNPS